MAMLELLQNNPHLYFGLVLALVISIVLHELAHGWIAIWLGDRTPITSGHMTPNPFVCMGPWSIVCLLLCGLAWGQMPYNPRNLRGRYDQAWIALAGPAVNLLLAFISLTALAAIANHPLHFPEHIEANLEKFLMLMGFNNLLLAVFNMLPVPPLDGSKVLATFNHQYDDATANPDNQTMWLVLLIGAFFFMQFAGDYVVDAGLRYIAFVRSHL